MYFAPMFCPKKFRFFFLSRSVLFFPPHPPHPQKQTQTKPTKKSYQNPSLMSYYCNPSLIKSTDRLGGVLYGRPISMLSAHLTAPAASCCCF